MDWQALFDIAVGLVGTLAGGLGGYILKGIRADMVANTKSINDIHIIHLPKKVDKEDFTRLNEALFEKMESILAEVKTGNSTLIVLERDLRGQMAGLDRRVAIVENENQHRRHDNGASHHD